MIGFEGFGSALKPAYEPVWMCRKPIAERNIIENILAHGTGAINVDGCRVGTEDDFGRGGVRERTRGYVGIKSDDTVPALPASPLGRWPANLLHDGSAEVVGLFPVTKTGGHRINGVGAPIGNQVYARGWKRGEDNYTAGDSGSAARFFKCCPMDDPDAEVKRLVYCAKASRADRNSGGVVANVHSTVKPQALCRYLVKLVTPPNGVVLDCFMGSGSVGVAAVKEGFRFVGVEKDPAYFEIAKARIMHALAEARASCGKTGKHNEGSTDDLPLFQKQTHERGECDARG